MLRGKVSMSVVFIPRRQTDIAQKESHALFFSLVFCDFM